MKHKIRLGLKDGWRGFEASNSTDIMTSHVTRIRHVRQSLHKCLLLTFNSIQKMNWHLRKQQMKRNYRIWFLELCDYFLFNFFIIRPTKYHIFRNLCFLLWISSTAKSSIKMNSALPFYTLYNRGGHTFLFRGHFQ